MKRILKVYFCWRELPIDDAVITSERVRMLLQFLTMLLRSVSHIFRRLRPSSLCLFPVLDSPPVPPTGLSPASLWQYIVFIAWSRWAHTLKLPTQTATCSAFVEMPLNPPAPIHRLFVLRIGRLALRCRRLSDNIHVHPSLGRYWPPLAGSQRSSDIRSCSRRSSCARTQRSGVRRLEADLPEWEVAVSVYAVTARL